MLIGMISPARHNEDTKIVTVKGIQPVIFQTCELDVKLFHGLG
jgi:hypothetical protein